MGAYIKASAEHNTCYIRVPGYVLELAARSAAGAWEAGPPLVDGTVRAGCLAPARL